MKREWSDMTLNEIKDYISLQAKVNNGWIEKLKQDSRTGVQKLGLALQRKMEAEVKEAQRVERMWAYEREHWTSGVRLIAGIDEAGRGPLAGPVVAAAVILPEDFDASGLNDSKQLTAEQRKALRERILLDAISVGVGVVDVDYIDEFNILQATFEAMRQAIKQCESIPELLLLDAVKLPGVHTNQISIIKGDAISHSIAAASVIAKTTRDQLMMDYAQLYPEYGFDEHKGYSAPRHYEALDRYGPCPIHRRSFQPIADRLANDLFYYRAVNENK
jgi:ribonuclease HII